MARPQMASPKWDGPKWPGPKWDTPVIYDSLRFALDYPWILVEKVKQEKLTYFVFNFSPMFDHILNLFIIFAINFAKPLEIFNILNLKKYGNAVVINLLTQCLKIDTKSIISTFMPKCHL